MGIVLGAGEEADEGAALEGDVITDGATEHRVLGFEDVQDRALGDRGGDFQADFARNMRQGAEMSGERYTDHGHLQNEI